MFINFCYFRTSKLVDIWNIPILDYKYPHFTCFSSDNLYTIMTGQTNGIVTLWDQRQNVPIQVCITFKLYMHLILYYKYYLYFIILLLYIFTLFCVYIVY
jgi:hypothetical protein